MLVVGLGEVLWDCLPSGRQLGGAPANFAYHISQFGLTSCVVSAVGKDDLGAEIIENLQSKKISFNIPQIEFPTGTVQVTLDGLGVPNYIICENVAWDNIPFSSQLKELAENASAVCFGSLAQRSAVSHNTILSFLNAMPEGSKKVFDINLRQNYYSKRIISESLSLSDIFKINDEELKVLRGMFNYTSDGEDLCRRIMDDFNLEMLVLTCGTDGSCVYSSVTNERSFLPTPKVKVADTVGAGDSFTAALVASFLQGKSLIDAHRIAVDTSAYVCTQHGAMPSYKK
ncbi:MAG: carbohydrate kinase [Paludibacteraceae bacterium]|nr:carbohydrate kinase [Paludibacteraceae bacterium]